MNDVTPNQKKIESGGSNSESKAEIHDRTGLLVAILAFGVGMFGLGVSIWSSKAQDDKVKSLETQVLLLREDVRQATIEAARK